MRFVIFKIKLLCMYVCMNQGVGQMVSVFVLRHDAIIINWFETAWSRSHLMTCFVWWWWWFVFYRNFIGKKAL